ncbi:hypothetical protein QKU48_gp0979 [Fadolivirus algeromassiliense]|jgi:hypothetical protein|uniref:Uncharacterized protein n=1 Tax=Fadolivirus FV1/VV64 TaxID=3070911 RepID=A0A7D3V920_9VIRU|nr:hypothetical protein QKU48_gp0979 [Fadolivirus algeromassiliense]QKF94437.1 hypothetical protein Fadolivirus_1_979 [Fadolivirus FV1/VV64]
MILLTVYKYRIYCTIDQQWEYVWDTTPPTVCPVNSLHTINANSVSIEDTIVVVKIDSTDTPYKVKQHSVFCDTTNGNIILYLPKATRSTKLHYIVKKTATANIVTVTPYGSELIDSAATKTLSTLNETILLQSDGTGWNSTSYYNSLTIENEFKPSTMIATRQKGDMLIDNGSEMISLPLGTNNYALLADSSQASGVKWAQIDHTDLVNIGTNTHAQIDSHISASSGIHGVVGNIVGTSDTQTLTNKSLVNNNTSFVDLTDLTKMIKFNTSSATTGTTLTLASAQTGNRTLNLPDASDTLVARNTTDTLANKSLQNNTVFHIDQTDATKKLGFSTSGATTGTTLTLAGTQTTNRTLTFPDATDTIVGRATTDTLTNKTLTAPIISQIVNTGTLTLPTSTDTLVGRATTDTLTNKTLDDSTTYFADNSDNTKKMQFQLSGITASTTRTLTVPNADTTLVGTDTTQTLTNKTLTNPTISQINNTGTLTLPTSTDTLVGRTTTDTLTNKTLIDNSTIIADQSDQTKQIRFDAGGTTATSTTIVSSQSANRTITLPDTTDTLLGRNTTDTLANKSLQNNTNFFVDNADATKKIGFSSSGATTGTTTTISANQSTNRTIVLPDATTTLVGTDTTQTITNKTLTAPIISQIVNTGTLTLPTSTDTLVGRDTTDTLTNKTLTAPIISQISNTGTLTLPTSTDTLIGRATTDTLSNKSFSDNLNMSNNKIINVAIPTSATDAANKAYVDSAVTGLDLKQSVYVATTADFSSNTSISGSITYNATGGSSGRGQITGTLVTTNTFVVDDVTLTSSNNGARILIKNQSSGAQNGIYTVTISGTSLTLDRASDFDEDIEVTTGAFTFIELGTVNGNSGWTLATPNPIIIGGNSGTSLSFTQFSGTGQITAGAGLTKTGNMLDIGGSNTIISNADNIEVNSSGTANQILLSSGTVGIAATYGALPLGNTNAVTGILGIANGGSGVSSFTAGDRIIATNSGNTALTTTSLDPSAIATLTGTQTLTNKTLTTPIISSIVNTGTLTLPTSTDTLIGRTTSDTLTNKTLVDASTYFADDLDLTKRMQFQLSSITTTTTRTLTIPDADMTLVGTTTTQTLTNKTLSTPIIAFISNGAGLITVPSTTDTLVGRQTSDTLTNKTLIDASTVIADSTDNTKQIKFDSAGTTSTSTTIQSSQTANRTLTLPDATDTLIGRTTTDTLTNKSLNNASVSFVDLSDPTKKVKFATNSATTGTATTISTYQTVDRIVSLPDATTTLVGTDTTQTLTNKTLTAPIISQISNTGTLTLPTSTTTLIGTDTTDILTNKTMDDATTYFTDNLDNTKKMQFQLSDITTATTRTITVPDSDITLVGTSNTQTLTNKTLTAPIISSISNIGTLTLPTSTDTLVGRATTDTLTNKTLIDNSTIIADAVDLTKQIRFDAGGTTSTNTTITAAQTANRTITLPDATTTLVGTDTTQTLTNKTLTSPIIANISNTGTLTLPTSTDTLVGRNTTDTLTNKTLTSPIISTIVNTGTLTLPTSTDTLVARSTSDTLANKSLRNDTCLHVDPTDTTKKIGFVTSGATTATTLTLAGVQTASRTLTLPDATDTLVGRNTTDTLTNKTLTSPIISSINNTGTLTLPTSTDTLVGRTTTDTLTNKTLIDNSTVIADLTDLTKQIRFDAGGSTSTSTTITATQTANRTITLPDASTTLVGTDTTQTLTNKTLTTPVISSISNTGTLTLPTSTDTLIGRTTTDTLTNKTLIDNSTIIADNADQTKQIKFDAAGTTATSTTILSSQTANRILTLPDATDTLVGKATTDTLTNKTLTTPIISQISNTGTLTLPTSTDTLVGRATTDTLANKSLQNNTVFHVDQTDATKKIGFNSSSASSATTLTLAGIQTTNRTVTFPDATTILVGTDTTQTLTNKTLTTPIISQISNTGTLTLPTTSDTLVGRSTTDTLTNKTLIDASVVFADSGDQTKQIRVDAGGTTATSTTITAAQTANRVITLPDATDTLVGRATTDTLTNKTLTSPIISTIINTGTLTLPTNTDTLVARTTTDTLTNKTLIGASTYFADLIDNTKKMQFQLSGITTATTRTITIPDASTTLVGTDTTQTLTNKTLTAPIISTISNTGTLTLPTNTDTLVGRITTDTLTNKTLIDNSTIIADVDDVTKQIKFDAGGTTATSTTITAAQTANRILTLPDATDTLIGRSTTDTLANKSLQNNTNFFVDNADATKKIGFNTSSATTGTTITLSGVQTTNRTLTLPDATDTLVGRATTDTLTNKTLTAPIISTITNTGTLTLPTNTDTLVGRQTTDTLTNKSLVDASTYFVDDSDTTKKMQFQLSGITTATTRTITIPDLDTTLVGTNATQTLTNKTLTTPIISSISNTGTLTLPTSTDTLVGRATTDTLTNKTLVDTTVVFADLTDQTKLIKFDAGGTTATSTTITAAQTANRTITLPDATDTLVGRSTTDTLANKSLQNNTNFHVDQTDATKKIGFITSGATTSTTLTLAGVQTTNRTVTLPDATDTLVGRATTDTLTNKTLTAPVISQISNTGTLTLPTSTDTLVGRATTDTLTNKTITSTTNTIRATQLGTTGSDVVISGASAPTTGQSLVATSATTAAWLTAKRWILRDEKTTGTGGGGFTSGSWQTRTLNTTAYDGGSDVTLSSNQFTCAAGTYRIKASAIGAGCGIHQVRLYNVTGSSVVSYGLVVKPSHSDGTPSEVECIITPGSSTTYRLEHRCTSTNNTDGMGTAAGWGTEVYANVLIEKM